VCFNDGSVLLADALLDILNKEEFDYITGMEVGAIPIVQVVCIRSRLDHAQKHIDGFFVRKKEKTRGTKNKIDGLWHDKIITVIDRLEGAEETLKRENVKLIPLFTKEDFNIPTEEEWRKSPEKWL
jgi:orotate phosphoribosyltransferase